MAENKQMTPEEYRQIPATEEAIREFLNTRSPQEVKELPKYMTKEQKAVLLQVVEKILKKLPRY